MLSCEKTVYLFLKGTGDFLANTPYREATDYYRAEQEKESERVRRAAESIKVSVIMPIRGGTRSAAAALESARRQTHEQLEILLVDNNPSETDDEASQAANGDNRVVLLKEPRAGLSHARNRGLDHATGQYVAFLNPEDLWTPEKIERQLSYMELHGVEMSHTSYSTLGADGKAEASPMVTKGGRLFPAIVGDCTIATSTVMVSKAFLDQHKLRFQEDLQIGEDVCLWIEIANLVQVGYLEESLTNIRLPGDTAVHDARRRALALLNVGCFALKNYDFDVVREHVARLSGTASRYCGDENQGAMSQNDPLANAGLATILASRLRRHPILYGFSRKMYHAVTRMRNLWA
jgi:glycosyltransferase involved in cell wall biosynthesis